MYQRVGTGRQAELADIRDKPKKAEGEETKEDIIREAVDQFPKSEIVIEKVRPISFHFGMKCKIKLKLSLGGNVEAVSVGQDHSPWDFRFGLSWHKSANRRHSCN